MQSRLRLIRIWYALGGLLLLLVAVLSLVPIDIDSDVVSDKTGHVLAYAVLSGWFSLLAGGRTALGGIAIGLMAYGALIEILQGFTGYRFAEWGDLLANGLGILIGLAVYPTPLRRLFALIDSFIAERFQR